MKQYVQTDLEADRQVANTLAELIIGGSLASTALGDEDDDHHLGETARGQASLANPLADHMKKAGPLFEKRAGATRLCAWCENPIPTRALRDAVASNWTDAAGKAPRSFGCARWIVADL